MPRISKSALKEVQGALEEYRQEVEDTNLAQRTKDTYLRHADTFVRWLDYDFEPGGNVPE